jgi:hypothetical protein
MGVDSWRHAPRRVWGWSAYLETPEPVEGAALRQAAADVIAGESVFTIARQWNADPRLHTVYGGPWSGLVIAKIMQRCTNAAGLVSLLDHGTFEAVVAALQVRRPPRTRVAGNGNRDKVGVGRYVVTSVARCGVCGSEMRNRGRQTTGQDRMACRRSGREPARDGQRHPTVLLLDAERKVHEAVVVALAEAESISTSSATTAFDSMTLLQRRALAARYLRVVVEPMPGKQMGHLLVERRTA